MQERNGIDQTEKEEHSISTSKLKLLLLEAEERKRAAYEAYRSNITIFTIKALKSFGFRTNSQNLVFEPSTIILREEPSPK